MKTLATSLLVLSLLTVCQARPFSSKDNQFKADFPGPVQVSQDKHPPTTSYEWDRDSKDRYIVAVVRPGQKLTRYQAYKLLLKDVVADVRVTHRELMFQGRPALEIAGLDLHGGPIAVLLIPDGDRVYMVGAATFDMAKQREFLQSFRLLTPPPHKR